MPVVGTVGSNRLIKQALIFSFLSPDLILRNDGANVLETALASDSKTGRNLSFSYSEEVKKMLNRDFFSTAKYSSRVKHTFDGSVSIDSTTAHST